MFGGKTKFLPQRDGERYKSSIVRTNLSNNIINKEAKIRIKNENRRTKKSLSSIRSSFSIKYKKNNENKPKRK